METIYTVGELKSLIKEASSKNEFKPVLGPEVEAKDKEINDKAYKDAEKIPKEHYGKELKAPEKAEYEKIDGNRTMLSHELDLPASKEWKERSEVQAQGYTSKDEKENGLEKTGDRENNEKLYKAIKKTDTQIQKNKKIVRNSGLASHNLAADDPNYLDINNCFTDGKDKEEKDKKEKVNENHIKTAVFKKTQFITEGHMISRIPDEFKNEGCKFKMKDKNGNTYLLEWSDNKANILEHEDKVKFNESLDRMKNLFNYNSGDYFKNSSSSDRLNESNDAFTKTLNNARKMED